MQGIPVIDNSQGEPKTIIIDVEQHDNQLDPFVRGLLGLLQQQAEDRTGEPAERREFLYASGALANRAYNDDEPEYTDANLIERNPNYRPK